MERNNDSLLSLSDDIRRELVRERRPAYFNTAVAVCVITGLLSAVLYISAPYLKSGITWLKETRGVELNQVRPLLELGFWSLLMVAIVSGCLGVVAVIYGRVYWPRPRYQIWNEVYYFLSDLHQPLRYEDNYRRLKIRIKRVSRTLVKISVDPSMLPISRKKIMSKVVDNTRFFSGARLTCEDSEGEYRFYLNYEEAGYDEII